jgi:Uma2 family endonuclease
MSVNLANHLFTVSEYERMAETGILTPDARVELIDGQVIEMSPIGSPHAACVDLISAIFHQQLRGKAIVRTQSPIVLDDFSEPEPDVSVLKFREDYYRGAHPRPNDVLFVIEVSETTVQFDRQVKTPLYARAGIREFLLISLPDEHAEYYSRPERASCQDTKILRRGDRFESAIAPGLTLDVGKILGI